MIARNVSRSDLEWALERVSADYENNIMFREIEPKGKGYRFTLTVKDSNGPGHRLGFA